MFQTPIFAIPCVLLGAAAPDLPTTDLLPVSIIWTGASGCSGAEATESFVRRMLSETNRALSQSTSQVTLGLSIMDPGFDTRLSLTYNQAISAGLWANTFAATDAGIYFAEGIQDWFDANQQADPADGTNNFVNTRVELKAYDPNLASLIADYMPDDALRPVCP